MTRVVVMWFSVITAVIFAREIFLALLWLQQVLVMIVTVP